MTKPRKKPLKKARGAARSVLPYTHEFRIKVARLCIEYGCPTKLVASQFAISDYRVYRWGKNYRLYSEQGLVD